MDNYFLKYWLLNILHGAWNSYPKSIAPCKEESQSLYSGKSGIIVNIDYIQEVTNYSLNKHLSRIYYIPDILCQSWAR